MPQYTRPPITEVVIEVRVNEPVGFDSLTKVQRRAARTYPIVDTQLSFEMEVDPQGQPVNQRVSPEGLKLASEDGANVLLMKLASIGTCRLAPYQGWEALFAQAESNWRDWKAVVGYREISRIGVRFINRIDVPWVEGRNPPRAEDYIKVGVYFPTPEQRYMRYQLQTLLQRDPCMVLLNAATVVSPLVDHASILLDMDYYMEGSDLPQRDDELWRSIGMVRSLKNDMFEEMITDKARALFS